jgi:hypothetical protein
MLVCSAADWVTGLAAISIIADITFIPGFVHLWRYSLPVSC